MLRHRLSTLLNTLHPQSHKTLDALLLLCFISPLGSSDVLAQASASSVNVEQSIEVNQKPIVKDQRLSEWLLQNSKNNEAYYLGTSWLAKSEITEQTIQKNTLLQTLDKLPAPKREPSFETSRKALRTLIEEMPVTGRVALPATNPRFLEIQPKLNPILSSGDRVTIPTAPTSITVIRSDGLLCKVRYQANVEARQYFRACRSQQVLTDWAWIVEPDGTVKKVSTAAWNESKQDVPAPGSWIWSPPRGSGWTSREAQIFSEQFTAFLATQALSGLADSPDEGSPERRPATLASQEKYFYSRDLPISANVWGETGLLQTPSARTAPAGTGSITLGWWQPYASLNLALSPLDWFEFYFRYTNVNNVPYGSQELAGGQTYKDKSTGLKIRLLREDAYLPEVAVGVRDILGTGLFSGEYFVGSKRYSDFDFSLGLGWGQLGTRNNINNPFVTAFGSNYATRDAPVVGSGGTTNQQYFHGTAAVFGGVQYRTPWNNLVLKAEVDGNNYQQLPFGNTLAVKSIFNFGATYQMKNADFTIASLGNNQVMLTLSLHERLDLLSTPKLGEAKSIPVDLKSVGNYVPSNPGLGLFLEPEVTSASSNKAKTTTAANSTSPASLKMNYEQTLRDFEEQTHWQVKDLRGNQNSWTIDLTDASGVFLSTRINRGITALHRDAPPNIDSFHLKFYNWGMLVSEFKINRQQWMLSQTQLLAPSLRAPSILTEVTPEDTSHPFFGKGFAKSLSVTPASAVESVATAIDPTAPVGFNQLIGALTPSEKEVKQQLAQEQSSKLVETLPSKRYETNLGVSYDQIAGSPSAPLLFSFGIKTDGVYKFRENTWLSGTLNLRVVDNFGKYNYDPPPTGLQPVRTNIRQYMTQSLGTMPNFQATNTGKLSNNQFVSAYAGYLEMMFAGAGGEYLGAPPIAKLLLVQT